jgi:hypothetical protein
LYYSTNEFVVACWISIDSLGTCSGFCKGVDSVALFVSASLKWVVAEIYCVREQICTNVVGEDGCMLPCQEQSFQCDDFLLQKL